MPDKISNALSLSGVSLHHVPLISKNEPDGKLKQLIDEFMYKYRSNFVIIIITCDKSFAIPIETARKNNIPVILIYGKNSCKDFINTVDE